MKSRRGIGVYKALNWRTAFYFLIGYCAYSNTPNPNLEGAACRIFRAKDQASSSFFIYRPHPILSGCFVCLFRCCHADVHVWQRQGTEKKDGDSWDITSSLFLFFKKEIPGCENSCYNNSRLISIFMGLQCSRVARKQCFFKVFTKLLRKKLPPTLE